MLEERFFGLFSLERSGGDMSPARMFGQRSYAAEFPTLLEPVNRRPH